MLEMYLNTSLIIILVMLLGDEDGFIVVFCSPDTECSTLKSQVCTELGSPFHSNKDLFSAACRCVTVQCMIAALMFTISGKDHNIRQRDHKEHSHSNQLEMFAGPWHVGTPLQKQPDLQHSPDFPWQNSCSFCSFWHLHKFCNSWGRSLQAVPDLLHTPDFTSLCLNWGRVLWECKIF